MFDFKQCASCNSKAQYTAVAASMCLYECLFIYLFYIIDFFCDLLFFKNLFVRFALTKYKLQLFSQSHYVHKEEEEFQFFSCCFPWPVRSYFSFTELLRFLKSIRFDF